MAGSDAGILSPRQIAQLLHERTDVENVAVWSPERSAWVAALTVGPIYSELRILRRRTGVRAAALVALSVALTSAIFAALRHFGLG